MEKSDDVATRRSSLSPNKRALLEKRLRPAAIGKSQTTIPRRKPGSRIPLSFAQQRLWFLQWLLPTSPAYNEAGALHIRGPLDVEVFFRAIRAVAQRHEILRSTFRTVDGEPEQVVHAEPHPEMTPGVVDLTGLLQSDRRSEAIERMQLEIMRPVDLETGPVTRFVFFQTGPEEFYLVHTMHHIVSDSWSLGIFMKEIAAHYRAYLQNAPAALPELPIQYGDYACWERENANFGRQLAYWRSRLVGAPPFLELPTDHPRRADRASRAGRMAVSISSDVIARLRSLARQESATPFMILLAGFAALLHRYSGQPDILIGTPVAGRTLPELENLIGFLVNTLVLRIPVEGRSTFLELVKTVKAVVLGAVSHDDMPFERLVQEIQPARSLRHTPLFQVMFQFDNFRRSEEMLAGLTIEGIELPSAGAKFDLTLVLQEEPDRLGGYLEYDADLFDVPGVTRMARYLQELIADAVRNPGTAIGTLALLTAKDREQQLLWQEAEVHTPVLQDSIHQLFERQAQRAPEAIAVVSGSEQLSYSTLSRRANQIAHRLRGLGAGPGTTVGICMPRCPDLIAAMLGVLKSGAAYIPLDPRGPAERVDFMLRDANVKIALTQTTLLDLVSTHAQVLCLDGRQDQIEAERTDNLVHLSVAEHLAYIIYTSGSTGTPKGVMVSHKSLVNYIAWASREFEVRPGDRLLQFASIAFDTSVEEIFVALTTGATLVLRDEEILYSAAEFLKYCRQWQITVLDLPTAFWHELVASFASDLEFPKTIRLVVIGGEKAISRVLDAWKRRVSPSVRLINTYGPTEATISATYSDLIVEQVSPDLMADLSIGRPIHNLRVRILNELLQLVPLGVAGELHIGGAGLAAGYLNDPELTAQRFIPDPYKPAELLYKSGDRARYRSDGKIEFLGRLDDQEKIRGFRVSLSEIEATMRRHPAVRDCAAIPTVNEQGDKGVTAYVLTASEHNSEAAQLRSFLKDKLPGYMIPGQIVFLDNFPLTSNGKVDRQALSAIRPNGVEAQPSPSLEGPRTGAEEIMSLIWAQVLGREQIGIHEDFFVAGGHSLLGMRLVSRIREVFQRDVTVRQLFEAPTIAGLTAEVSRTRAGSVEQTVLPLRPAPHDSVVPLTAAQRELWELDEALPGAPFFNIIFETRLVGKFDCNALADAFFGLISRHESLRTVFQADDGKPVQVIVQPQPFSLTTYDLRDFSEADRKDAVSFLRDEFAKYRFDLVSGPLFVAALLQLGIGEHILLIVFHHIIADGWSIDIIARDLEALYCEAAHGKPSQLPQLPIRYADYAIWQQQALSGAHREHLLSYWLQHLAGPLQPVMFPPDRPMAERVRSLWYGRDSVNVPGDLARELRAFCRAESATLFMVLASFVKILLHQESGADDVRIGTTCAGRTWASLEPVVGMFTNTIVLRTEFPALSSLREVVRRVRRVALEALDHQDLPFEVLAAEWAARNGTNASALYQVLFLFENAVPRLSGIPGVSSKPMGDRDGSERDTIFSNFPLIIEAVDGTPLTILFRYDPYLYDSSTVRRLLTRFLELIGLFTTRPDELIERGRA